MLGLVRGALMYGRRVISGRQALGVEYDLRDELYSHFLRLSFGFYDRSQTGQLMSRATIDLQSVRFFLGYGLIFFAQHVVTIVVVTVVLFFYSWKLALVALAITPVIVLTAYRYSRVSHPVLRDVQQTLAEVATVAEESITGVHVVKSFAQEERRAERFADAAEHRLREDAGGEPAARDLRAPPDVPAAGRAGARPARRRADGDLRVAVARRVLRVQPPARDARHAAADARHVDRPGPARDRRRRADLRDPRRAGGGRGRHRCAAAAAGPGEVVFEDVSFGYDPERLVLEDVDLRVPAGPDGRAHRAAPARARRRSRRSCRGSTTRPRVACSWTASTSATLVRRSLRREIGVISQDPFLFSASIRDNIALGMPDAPHEAVEAAARAAQAHEFILELPHGYDTVVGERGITLSGGQRQRIAIARALLIDPRILILDDATASVDATTEAKIRAGLREVMRGRTTIIIAHRLSTIALADEVVVLDEGRIAARGTQAELLETSPVFREIHEHGLLQQVVAG